jgi:hypothetical protein
MNKLTAKVIKKFIEYYEGDNLRVNHALKVYGFAASIGALEGLEEDELLCLEIAAVLHDIGIKLSEIKYNSAAGNYQELEGPPEARKLLEEFRLDEKLVERVCYLIGHHHSYSYIDGLDFQILIEADFLVNIFENNLKGEAIQPLKNKYFKTDSGKMYFDTLYII